MKLLIILILFSISLLANDASLIHIKGDVRVKRGNDSMKASLNKKQLSFNDVISTGINGLAIIKVGKGSTFKINKNSTFKILAPKNPKEDSNILLRAGSVFAKFQNERNGKTMKVKTKSASMGVRGTEFFVSYGTSNNDTWMCVNEGVVQVDSDKRKGVNVKAGEGVKVSKSVSDPKFLPWTKKLNWNFNPKKDLENKVSIEDAYKDPLNFDYD